MVLLYLKISLDATTISGLPNSLGCKNIDSLDQGSPQDRCPAEFSLNFQVQVGLIRVGAKLCRTPAFQDQVWSPLI